MNNLNESHNILAQIKLESDEYFNNFNNNEEINKNSNLITNNQNNPEIDEDFEVRDQFDSALVECLDSNEKINENINNFIRSKKEKLNKKNLINYCGIIDSNTKMDGCARSNSIYVAKYGNSHIKKSKIINPYGALSQMYHHEMVNLQKKKLLEYTNSYVKRMDLNEFKKNQNQN